MTEENTEREPDDTVADDETVDDAAEPLTMPDDDDTPTGDQAEPVSDRPGHAQDDMSDPVDDDEQEQAQVGEPDDDTDDDDDAEGA